ncbi:MAG: putative lipid II flippase FtsW [Rhodocyclaceae bacterium]|nr:putative lipid II flippase FtsW [Rhodocyclaceae bacterium]
MNYAASGLQGRRLLPIYDPALLFVIALIAAMGVVMVFSASIATAELSPQTHFDALYFLKRQVMYLAGGTFAAMLVFQVEMRTWQRAAPWIFGAGMALLVLVLVPGIGAKINGARRWIPFGIISLQPAELMKLAVVLYAADYTVRKAAFMHSWTKGLIPLGAVILLAGGLVILQPDAGSFAVMCAITAGILWLGGMRVRIFLGLMALLGSAFFALIVSEPFRVKRIAAFMNPWDKPMGDGYQLTHSLMAFGRGEWFGVGLGAGMEKQGYLPEAHNDFLMAVIAEETGFFGVTVVLVVFAWLVWRAFLIGRQAIALDRTYAALVAQGIGVWLGTQALVHAGVSMGALPTKGLTLPLMSFGGSALMAISLALAILLRVDFENRLLMRGKPV